MNKYLFATSIGLMLSFNQVYADGLKLDPNGLVESLSIGSVVISDNSLVTEHGVTLELEVLKKTRMDSTVRIYYKILGQDNLNFCDNGSEANFIELEYIDPYGAHFKPFQNRTSASGKEYIAQCGYYSYAFTYSDYKIINLDD